MTGYLVLATDESIWLSTIRQHSSFGPFRKTLLFVVAVCLSTAAAIPNARAQDTKHALIHKLTVSAMHVEDSGDLNQAESLYQNALEEAKRVDAKNDMVEIISRLVRLRIDSHKLLQTGPLVQQAVGLVNTLKARPADNAEMSIWDRITSPFQKPVEEQTYVSTTDVCMNDMADAFYTHGERTANEHAKEFCLERYLDCEFAIQNKLEPKLIARTNLLDMHLYSSGRYLEALPYAEKLTAYLEQTCPIDNVIGGYQGLGGAYLGANKPEKAEAAFRHAIDLQNRHKKDLYFEAILERNIGQARAEENKFDEARAWCTKALNDHIASCTGPNLHAAFDSYVLALIEQRAGNLEKALQYDRMSLSIYDSLAPPSVPTPLNPGYFDSGGAVYPEHLAEALEASHKNLSLVQSLRRRAAKMRAKYPEWLKICPVSEQFFGIWGFWPYQFDIIPTRSN